MSVEVRARADADDEDAARELADPLARRGDLDELLGKQVRGEEAERLRRFGLNLDGSNA
jgi:hypothetical protein